MSRGSIHNGYPENVGIIVLYLITKVLIRHLLEKS